MRGEKERESKVTKEMRELAEGCLEGRAGRDRGRRRLKQGEECKCRIRCDIVNATVN